MNKTILIFGASTGLGRASAEHFAKENWNVFAVARSAEKLAELKANNTKVNVRTCDITKEEDVADTYSWVNQAHSIDAVLLTAGGGFITDLPLERTEATMLRTAFEVNTIGSFYVCAHAKNLFSGQQHGLLVGVGSRASLNQDVLPERVAYSASKHGQLAVIETLQRELEKDKIPARAVAVCPGFIPGTEMVKDWAKKHRPDENDGTPLAVAVELLFALIDNPDGHPEFLYLMEDSQLKEVGKYQV